MQALSVVDRQFCEMTYQDVEKLIYHTVNQFLRHYPGGDKEEMIREANYAFLDAYDSFDENRGTKFTTWLVRKIEYALKTLRREDAKRWNRCTAVASNDMPEQLFAVTDFDPDLWDLSEDANELIHAALDAPVHERGDAEVLMALFCENKGWGWDRLANTWKEVQEAVMA